jgi:hypothetical protein
VTIFRRYHVPAPAVLLLIACGSSGPDDPPGVDCSAVAPTNLAVGQSQIIDAAAQGCVRFPAAGAAGAEHLYVALAGEGTEVPDGITADYELDGGSSVAAARAQPRVAGFGSRATGAAGRFHDRLRSRERDLAARGGGAALSRAPRPAVAARPPTEGEQRTFKVCETPPARRSWMPPPPPAWSRIGWRSTWTTTRRPAATRSRSPGVATLFDGHLYAIDTAAFGRESDIDINDVVIVLLTQRVNQLSGDCNTTGSVILGYFFGLDLLPSQANSNGGEVFYGLVPDPNNPSCDITKDFANGFLPPVFIHEFQHMISFNQHVLEAGSSFVEDTWLNEGLSHFAEELGGRLIPDGLCQPLFDNCESQFIGGNIDNAYKYLENPEASFLIEPGSSQGDLAERGANWLFVRWLTDHFAGGQPLGHDFTRQLVQTSSRGSRGGGDRRAVRGAGGLAARQLRRGSADFTPLDPRLQYTSWAFRDLYQSNFELGVFPKPYPLTPLVTANGAVGLAGTLRGGSGVHLRIVQPASAAGLELKLTAGDGASTVDDGVKPRIALVRIR